MHDVIVMVLLAVYLAASWAFQPAHIPFIRLKDYTSACRIHVFEKISFKGPFTRIRCRVGGEEQGDSCDNYKLDYATNVSTILTLNLRRR